ncbi:MAG: type IV secretion system protein [Arenimonas sp.]
MLRNKSVTPNIESALSQSINFEVTVVDLARRSERRAWFVAFSAITMSLILAGGYYYMLPLKEKVPYLVMADAYTGTSTVARLRSDFTENSITASEALNRSNVAHFVLSRESYDASIIGQSDWDTVFTMASPDVTAGYAALHAAINPDQPYKLYGKKASIRIKILSTSLIGSGKIDGSPKGATVRFQRSLYDKASGTLRPMDSRIASLEFVYKNNLKMDDQKRILNPLGFQVTSYRVDADYAAAPPLEGEAVSSFYGPAPLPSPPATPALDAQGNPLPAGAQLATPLVPVTEPVPANVPQENVPNNNTGASNR